jgi:hypothetical protein
MARSKTAANAILYYEAGQTYVPLAALTDSTDGTKWTSPDDQWSGYEGKEPVVRPNGLLTGAIITPAVSGTDNLVDVSAGTVWLGGVVVSVPAKTDLAAVRATTTGTPDSANRITSIVARRNLGDTDWEYAAVAGTDAVNSFSPTRDAAGGPPLIDPDYIEIGQVRFDSRSADEVAAAEIFQVPGTHQERADYPVWDEDWANGEITFAATVPAIHTGPSRRKVYAVYYTPIYSEVPNSSDFVPAETTHSVSSTPIYGGAIGARSSTLGQGSFTSRLASGVIDNFVKLKNYTLWFKFFPDRYRDEHILTQGVLGVSRQFPAGDSIVANCTISAESTSIDVES